MKKDLKKLKTKSQEDKLSAKKDSKLAWKKRLNDVVKNPSSQKICVDFSVANLMDLKVLIGFGFILSN